MKKLVILLSAILGSNLIADPIPMHWSDKEDGKPPVRHFLPRRPGMSSTLSVDKGESSILIEYGDTDFTVITARILDDAGDVVYENQTASSSLELPLPSAGDYTIEVRVDDTLYVGQFTVDE